MAGIGGRIIIDGVQFQIRSNTTVIGTDGKAYRIGEITQPGKERIIFYDQAEGIVKFLNRKGNTAFMSPYPKQNPEYELFADVTRLPNNMETVEGRSIIRTMQPQVEVYNPTGEGNTQIIDPQKQHRPSDVGAIAMKGVISFLTQDGLAPGQHGWTPGQMHTAHVGMNSIFKSANSFIGLEMMNREHAADVRLREQGASYQMEQEHKAALERQKLEAKQLEEHRKRLQKMNDDYNKIREHVVTFSPRDVNKIESQFGMLIKEGYDQVPQFMSALWQEIALNKDFGMLLAGNIDKMIKHTQDPIQHQANKRNFCLTHFNLNPEAAIHSVEAEKDGASIKSIRFDGIFNEFFDDDFLRNSENMNILRNAAMKSSKLARFRDAELAFHENVFKISKTVDNQTALHNAAIRYFQNNPNNVVEFGHDTISLSKRYPQTLFDKNGNHAKELFKHVARSSQNLNIETNKNNLFAFKRMLLQVAPNLDKLLQQEIEAMGYTRFDQAKEQEKWLLVRLRDLKPEQPKAGMNFPGTDGM